MTGEAFYKDGAFTGHKEYFQTPEGVKHEVEYDAQKVVSNKSFDKNGQLIEKKRDDNGISSVAKEAPDYKPVVTGEAKKERGRGNQEFNLGKDGFPKVALGPNCGKDTFILDLNKPEYKMMVDNLKLGQEIAIGRQPKREPKIAIPEKYTYVSRQHCSIKKMDDGSLILIDTSKNGTNLSITETNVRENNDRTPPPSGLNGLHTQLVEMQKDVNQMAKKEISHALPTAKTRQSFQQLLKKSIRHKTENNSQYKTQEVVQQQMRATKRTLNEETAFPLRERQGGRFPV